jgi:hypothetical protein
MNIHEIIHAWENSALPNDLDALAAMQNKIDDYYQKAQSGVLSCKNGSVMEMYQQESFVYSIVSEVIQRKIESLIPEKKGGVPV